VRGAFDTGGRLFSRRTAQAHKHTHAVPTHASLSRLMVGVHYALRFGFRCLLSFARVWPAVGLGQGRGQQRHPAGHQREARRGSSIRLPDPVPANQQPLDRLRHKYVRLLLCPIPFAPALLWHGRTTLAVKANLIWLLPCCAADSNQIFYQGQQVNTGSVSVGNIVQIAAGMLQILLLNGEGVAAFAPLPGDGRPGPTPHVSTPSVKQCR
jgi:hypothetical protein